MACSSLPYPRGELAGGGVRQPLDAVDQPLHPPQPAVEKIGDGGEARHLQVRHHPAQLGDGQAPLGAGREDLLPRALDPFRHQVEKGERGRGAAVAAGVEQGEQEVAGAAAEVGQVLPRPRIEQLGLAGEEAGVLGVLQEDVVADVVPRRAEQVLLPEPLGVRELLPPHPPPLGLALAGEAGEVRLARRPVDAEQVLGDRLGHQLEQLDRLAAALQHVPGGALEDLAHAAPRSVEHRPHPRAGHPAVVGAEDPDHRRRDPRQIPPAVLQEGEPRLHGLAVERAATDRPAVDQDRLRPLPPAVEVEEVEPGEIVAQHVLGVRAAEGGDPEVDRRLPLALQDRLAGRDRRAATRSPASAGPAGSGAGDSAARPRCRPPDGRRSSCNRGAPRPPAAGPWRSPRRCRWRRNAAPRPCGRRGRGRPGSCGRAGRRPPCA